MSNNYPYGYQNQDTYLIPTEDRTAAALAHGSTLIALVFSVGSLPFLGPLVMWLLYKDRSQYVRRAAASAFNFNIWLTLANIVAWILIFTVIGIPVAAFIFLVTTVMQVWCHLRATLKSLNGSDYRYPFQTRILS
ncbi:DUF4870 domain-containing protein [Luteococcus sp. H138]|uniref:DUF4870 domain-containing protein n=1 Tax=unclassified Luteococcus TaxID=2639923 RepID=UPI00313A9F79